MRIFFIALIVSVLFSCTPSDGKNKHKKSLKSTEQFNVEKLDSLLYIVAMGDVMLGTSFPDKSSLPPDSLDQFKEVRPFLQGADLVFANLEGTFLDDETAVPRDCKSIENCFRFRMPTYLAKQLKEAGINLISTANNHSNDFQRAGRLSTVETLDELGVQHAGIDFRPYSVFQLPNGKRVGFVAFSPNTGCNDLRKEAEQIRLVQKVDSLCDLLIVSAHIGGEGHAYLNISRDTEVYLSEQRGNPYLFSRKVIDAGADLFLGHGPHVPRAVDCYRNKFIVYSMGNFMTYSRIGITGYLGYAPLYKIAINKETGDFVFAELISFQQQFRTNVRLDSAQKTLKLVQELTTNDFPESPLFFNENKIFPSRK